jgi:putative sterol carrier protein
VENQSSESLVTEGTFEAEAPGLAGVVGRMRLMVGDQALGVLVVDNGRVKLTPDGPPVDVTLVCKSRDLLIKLLRGQLNPVIMALHAEGKLHGDRERGVKILYGLRGENPLVQAPLNGKDQ